MRRFLTVLSVVACVATGALAAGGLAFFGSYVDTKDPGTAYGGGAKLKIELSEALGLELRGAYLTGFSPEEEADEVRFDDLALIPVEADLIVNLPLEQAALYFGGGAGYYVLPEYDLVEGPGPGMTHEYDLDDTFGFFAVVGLELNLGESAALFVEGQYRWLEIEGAEVDGEDVNFDDEWVVDLGGLGGNVGLLFKF